MDVTAGTVDLQKSTKTWLNASIFACGAASYDAVEFTMSYIVVGETSSENERALVSNII